MDVSFATGREAHTDLWGNGRFHGVSIFHDTSWDKSGTSLAVKTAGIVEKTQGSPHSLGILTVSEDAILAIGEAEVSELVKNLRDASRTLEDM